MSSSIVALTIFVDIYILFFTVIQDVAYFLAKSSYSFWR